jgi:hypothetical protein
MKSIIISTIFLLSSCSYIVKRNEEYERQLPTRAILFDIQNETQGDNRFLAGQSWNQYWKDSVNQLKEIERDDLIQLIVSERRRRGLPEIR